MTSNLTPEELAEAVAMIAALDEKRTQGEWCLLPRQSASYKEHTYCIISEYAVEDEWCRGGYSKGLIADNHPYYNTAPDDNDAPFIAAAPLMSRIIRQLWAEREANRTVMQQARDAAQAALPYTPEHITRSALNSMIAALDAVLKGE